MDFQGAAHRECLVRSDLVEEPAVVLDFDAEGVPVVNLESVEMLVLQRAEGALADAVLVRALAAGADVDQLRPLLDVGGEANRLEAGAVVRDVSDRADLARPGIGEQLGERSGGQPLALGDPVLDGLDGVAVIAVVVTRQPSSSFDQ